MEKVDLFPGVGKFFKANLHCHSTFSDGRITVEEIKDYYQKKGYSIIAYTDHNRLVPHNELSDENFLALTSLEVDFNEDFSNFKRGWAQERCYHLNFISKDKDRSEFFPVDRRYDKQNVQNVIDRANREGYLVTYNHPRWSYQTMEDFIGLTGLFGFEVFNYSCETETFNGWGDYEYEHFLRKGGMAAAIAADDNHFYCQDYDSPYSDLCGGFTMVKSPDLEYDSVYNALADMNCYASSGVLIYGAYAEKNSDSIHVHVDCSPAFHVSVLTEVRATGCVRSNNDDLTSVDCNIPLETEVFRIEIHNKKGERALTRGYKTEELFK